MKNLILIPDNSAERLFEEIKTTKSQMFKRLYEQCSWYFKQHSLPKEHPMTSITYFGMAAANLSLMYLLTKQKQYLEEVKRWIFTPCKYEHWGKARMPDHDLDAAWILFGFSLAYNWVGEYLEEDEREELKSKLILQGERIYHFSIGNEGRWWSSGYWQNHNWICYAGLAAAGYALKDEYPMANEWTERAKDNFKIVSKMMADDGSDYEGVVYWRYGTIWMAIYFDLLKDQEGINLFEECSYMKNTFYYRLYQAAPNLEEIVNFGDCHDRRSGHSVAFYYKIASEYKNSHAQYMANWVRDNIFWREAYESGVKPGVMPEAFLELLWFDDGIKPEDFSKLPTSKYFSDLGLVVVRNNWQEDGIHFSFKCSNGGGNKAWEEAHRAFLEKKWHTLDTQHHHPDNNSFVLIGFNSFLAVDEGYSSKKKTRDHNTVLVDGKGYEVDGKFDIYTQMEYEAKAQILDYMSKDGYTYAAGETGKVYEKELELNKYERKILYTGNDYFIIIDELESKLPHVYSWVLHSDTYPKLENDVFVIENGPGKLNVHPVYPAEFNYEMKEEGVVANPTSANPTLIIEEKFKVLSVENKEPQKNMRFINVLQPDSIFSKKSIDVKYLENDYSYGISIVNGEKKEIVMFAKENKLVYEDINADGKWFSLNYVNGKLVKKFVY